MQLHDIQGRCTPDAAIAEKTCNTCGQTKEAALFVKDKKRPDGHYPRCKACSRAYYLSNRGNVLHTNAEYRKQNREKIRAHSKVYATKRFFYIRSQNLKLRHPKQGTASVKEIARLWRKQKGLCPLTGWRLTRGNAQLDHIIPIVRGGSGTIENLRWVHRDVNYAKRDLSDAEFVTLCQQVASSANSQSR